MLRNLSRLWCFVAGLFLLSGAVSAATIIVNSTADVQANDGKCTLREAIFSANGDTTSGAAAGECTAGSGADSIHFNIPGADAGCSASGVCTIKPTTDLPVLSTPITIDGYTQPGASVNTLAQGSNAVLKIVISAAEMTSFQSYGFFFASNTSTLRGLVVNGGFWNAIWATYDSSGNKVIGCFIGTNASGTAAVGNTWGINLSGADYTVGGTAFADRNLISANNTGIAASGVMNLVIQGNLVGTNAAGTAALPNGEGLSISDYHPVTLIGGTAGGAGNVISGNTTGLRVSNTTPSAAGVAIQGNRIGTDVTGTLALGNGGSGVIIGGSGVTVGGIAPDEGNVVAFNGTAGVLVDFSTFTSGVTIRGNAIYGNGGSPSLFDSKLGIELMDIGGPGPTPNDSDDPDNGPNGLQNYPVVNSVTPTSVSGTFNSEASKAYAFDFYASPVCNASGFGEGKTYLGSKDVTTNASGNATWTFSVAVPAGEKVSVTATAPDGSTSEFSRCANLMPAFLDADPISSAAADGDGVFEPGETATVRPTWLNPTDLTFTPLTSTVTNLTGPAGASYATTDNADDYGSIVAQQTGSCSVTSNCLTMSVSDPAVRPSVHWDAVFTETLSSPRDGGHAWKLHLGDSFSDVPRSHLFYKKIETVFHNAVTVGCTPTTYCPEDQVPRDQMAIFLARAIAKGGANVPASGTVNGQPYDCVAGGHSLFSDVAPTAIACKSIHYIAAKNVTAGCSAGMYCPTQTVNRAQMAIFVAKGIVAPAGGPGVPLTYTDPVSHFAYSCNPASPNTYFTDAGVSETFCKHVHYLFARNVIAGCSGNGYCPDLGVTRGEMAKFLSNAFNLLLYGP